MEQNAVLRKKTSWLETIGNKIWDPSTIFLVMIAILMVVSKLMSTIGVSVLHPVSGKTVQVVDLLTAASIGNWISSATRYYQNFVAMPMILVGCIGMSLADKTGLLGVAVDRITRKFSKTMLIAGMIFVGILGNYTGDIIYMILPPIAAAAFLRKGMNPLVGIFAAYAGCGLGFSSNILISMTDLLVVGFTNPAAQTIDPAFVASPAMSYYFLIASTLILVVVGTVVTNKVVVPRLGKYDNSLCDDSVRLTMEIGNELTADQKKGLKWAGISLVFVVAVIAFFTVGPINVFADENRNIFTNNAPLMAGTIIIASLLCFIPGLVYGKITGQIKTDKDAVAMMVAAMRDMAPFIVFAFVISQFVNLFNVSNIGTIIAISMADFLKTSGFVGIPLFLLTILFFSIVNLFIGSISSKWAFMAYIFVPMYMLLGYSPELVSTLYRIGDSATNILSPLYTFAVLVLITLKRYKKDAGYGTLIRNMVPYAIWMSLALLLLFVLFYLAGLPLGPGSPYTYTLPF